MDDTFTTLILVIFTLSLLIITKFLKRCEINKFMKEHGLKQLRGPTAWPVLGNLLQIGPRPFIGLTRMRQRYGDIYKVKIGSWDAVVLNGDALNEAFKTRALDFAGRPPFPMYTHVISGHSYTFSSYSEEWRSKKKIITRSIQRLTKGMNSEMERHMMEAASSLVSDMVNSKQPVQPDILIRQHHMSFLLTMMYGPCGDSQERKQEANNLRGAFDKFVQSATKFALYDFIPLILTIFPSLANQMKKATKEVDKHILHHTTEAESMQNVPPGYIMNSFMSLDAGKAKPSEIRRLPDDLLGAGLDTTSNALLWIVLYLAKFPRMQNSIREEIKLSRGFQRLIESQDIEKMPYTVACIYEICRHAAVMPLTIPHYTLKDTVVSGYFIPKDTVVFGNLHAQYRDGKVWDNPDHFDPNRFLQDIDGKVKVNASKVNSMNMYGLGKRRCVGQVIAKLELFLILATTVQKCVISEDVDHPLPFGLGLFEVSHRPLPYKVRVQPFVYSESAK